MDPARTRELVEYDDSVMTEVADTLWRESKVPFRIGHSLASHGWRQEKLPLDLTYEEFPAAYSEAAKSEAPSSAERFRRAMSPE